VSRLILLTLPGDRTFKGRARSFATRCARYSRLKWLTRQARDCRRDRRSETHRPTQTRTLPFGATNLAHQVRNVIGGFSCVGNLDKKFSSHTAGLTDSARWRSLQRESDSLREAMREEPEAPVADATAERMPARASNAFAQRLPFRPGRFLSCGTWSHSESEDRRTVHSRVMAPHTSLRASCVPGTGATPSL